MRRIFYGGAMSHVSQSSKGCVSKQLSEIRNDFRSEVFHFNWSHIRLFEMSRKWFARQWRWKVITQIESSLLVKIYLLLWLFNSVNCIKIQLCWRLVSWRTIRTTKWQSNLFNKLWITWIGPVLLLCIQMRQNCQIWFQRYR